MAISMTQPMRPAEIDLVKQVNQNTDGVAANKQAILNEVIDRKNAVDAEANARISADNALQANITAEAKSREESDNALQANIDAERTRAEQAESTIKADLNNEIARAKEAEQTNATTILTETANRTTADRTLQQHIDDVNAKFPVQTDDIGDAQVTNAKLADNAISAAKIEDGSVTSAKIGNSQVDNTKITDKAVTNEKLSDSLQAQAEFLTHVPAMEFGTSNTVDVPANSNTRIDINFSATKTEAPIVICGLQHDTGNLNCIVTGVTNQQFSVTVYNLASTDVTGATIDWLAISGR